MKLPLLESRLRQILGTPIMRRALYTFLARENVRTVNPLRRCPMMRMKTVSNPSRSQAIHDDATGQRLGA
jgi:hypothetical protein